MPRYQGLTEGHKEASCSTILKNLSNNVITFVTSNRVTKIRDRSYPEFCKNYYLKKSQIFQLAVTQSLIQ